MASAQELKSRIDSVSKTKQITRSMRMVSSSKVYKSRRIFEGSVPYYEQAKHMMEILSVSSAARKNLYFTPAENVEKILIVTISTDRGLCGAYNMNIARKTLSLLKEFKNKEVEIVTVGAKVNASLKKDGAAVKESYPGISESPFYEEADIMVEGIMRRFQSKKVQEVYLVHTEFLNMLEQRAVVKKLLPFTQKPEELPKGTFTFEPAGEQLIQNLVPTYLNALLYTAMCESALCEQSARVSSMDAAARNSDELVEKLTLQYNQMRQASITNSIIEISGGVAAQEDKK